MFFFFFFNYERKERGRKEKEERRKLEKRKQRKDHTRCRVGYGDTGRFPHPLWNYWKFLKTLNIHLPVF